MGGVELLCISVEQPIKSLGIAGSQHTPRTTSRKPRFKVKDPAPLDWQFADKLPSKAHQRSLC
jgi:hypothetical protein